LPPNVRPWPGAVNIFDSSAGTVPSTIELSTLENLLFGRRKGSASATARITGTAISASREGRGAAFIVMVILSRHF
jgi:hypothetical protein